MESGKIIVVANQKGGVAKTSTVRNLSYALAEMGKKVLVVDFDPQYNLTTSFGVLPTQAPYNTGTLITNLLLDESLPDTNEFIQKIGSVDLIPSSRSLTVAEANLLMTPDSNDYLAALLNPLRLSYDYIIVDTNPSLGSLTINALTAADEVIIPIDPELFALTGLQALVDTIKKIKRKLNPSIEIGGILFTKCNKRTNLYRRTYGQVTKAFQSLPIFNCQIPYTVKVGDANSYGMSVMELEQANPASCLSGTCKGGAGKCLKSIRASSPLTIFWAWMPQKKALLNLPLPYPCRPRIPSSPFPRRPFVLSEAIRSGCMRATGSMIW